MKRLAILLLCISQLAFGQKNQRSYLFAKWFGNGPIAQIAMTNSFGMPLDSSGYVLFNQALTGGVTAYLDSRGLNRDANGYVLVDCATGCAGATTAFSALTSATNSTAAMVVGSGASLAATGSGTIAATSVTPTACSTVTFSATPTFSGASSTNCFSITLTGAVTSSTFSNGVNGAIYTFIVIQDSTGGRAFVPPSQMKQYGTWMATASNEVVQQFIYDGTNLNALAPWNGDTRPFTANAMDDEADSNACNTSSLWAWSNQGSATCTQGSGLMKFTVPNESTNARIIYQALPATPWGYTAKIVFPANANNANTAPECGIWMQESATSKLTSLAFAPNGTNAPTILVTSHYTNNTTRANGGLADYSFSSGIFLYLRISDDGTTLTYAVSTDGIFFQTLFTEAKAAFFTTAPDRIGLGMSSNSAGATTSCVVDWFRRTQ